MRMYHFYTLVLVPVLGLVGLLLLVSSPPRRRVVGRPLAGRCLFVRGFGGGVHLVFFLLERCLGPRKGDS